MNHVIRKLYCDNELSLVDVANKTGINESLIVKSLRMQGIQLRPSRSLVEKNQHEVWPTHEQLNTNLSLAMHAAYLCEGWHTEKTDKLIFTNTDPLLIDLFIKGMEVIYGVKDFLVQIFSASKESSSELMGLYPRAMWYLDSKRKKTIVRIKIKGKNLAWVFISNAIFLISKD